MTNFFLLVEDPKNLKKKRNASVEIHERTNRHEGKAAYGMEEISLVDRAIPGTVLTHLEVNVKSVRVNC
jgi:hypothetical protein